MIVFIMRSFISYFNFSTSCPLFYKYLNVDARLLLWPVSSFFIIIYLLAQNYLLHTQDYFYSRNNWLSECNFDLSFHRLVIHTFLLQNGLILTYRCTAEEDLLLPSARKFSSQTSNPLSKMDFLCTSVLHISDH